MELLKEWIMGLAGAGIISAVCLAVTPEGKVKKVVRLACGMLTFLCLISPLTGGRIDFSEKIAATYAEAEDFMTKTEETKQNITRTVIHERLKAYISDKGAKLGLEVTDVKLKMRWSTEGFWYPVSAEITAGEDDAARKGLSDCITADLGIDAENIYWS